MTLDELHDEKFRQQVDKMLWTLQLEKVLEAYGPLPAHDQFRMDADLMAHVFEVVQ